MTNRLTYTVLEVAEMLGISRSTAYECVRRGQIPALKLAGRVVISRIAFETLLAGGTSASRSSTATLGRSTDPLTPR